MPAINPVIGNAASAASAEDNQLKSSIATLRNGLWRALGPLMEHVHDFAQGNGIYVQDPVVDRKRKLAVTWLWLGRQAPVEATTPATPPQSRRVRWSVRAAGWCAAVGALTGALPGGGTSVLAAQDEQVVAVLRGETGIEPAPGTLLATVSGLSIQSAPLAAALSRLAESSQVQIAFSSSLLPDGLRVNCDCMTMSVARALDQMLVDTHLGYLELAAQVVVVPRGAQEVADLRGRVRSEVAIPIEDATVRLRLRADTARQLVTWSDRLGFFVFDDLTPGDYGLTAARIGYAVHETEVALINGADLTVEITLSEQPIELEGVVVAGGRTRRRAWFERSAGLTVQELARAALKLVPAVAEADPVRSVEVLPGVTRVSDFAASFNVRGGSADQNLILLDGVPIFTPFHGMGAFSVFNPDALKWAELKSGGFPARYGGRVSSVLLLESDMGDGELDVDAALGLLSSRATAKGSLPGNLSDGLGLVSARWQLSVRRSYLDLLTRPFLDAPFPYWFQSAQAAFEGWTNYGDRVRITAYSGRDGINLRHAEILDGGGDLDDWEAIPNRRWSWGNDAVGASWTRPRPGGGAWDLYGSVSRFDADLELSHFGDVGVGTRIAQWSLGADLERRLTADTRWTSGLATHRMDYDNDIHGGAAGYTYPTGLGKGWGSAAYTQIHWRPTSRWLVEGGLRLDHWSPGDHPATVTLSPRIAVKRFLHQGAYALRAAAGRYTQFVHSLRDEEAPLDLDWWMLAGNRAPALVSDQIQGGIEAFWNRDGWFGSLEGYYRTFDGVVTQNWADDAIDPADDLLPGDGLTYGADLLIRKYRGKTSGWISVSLLKATRTFPDTDSGLDPAPLIEYPPVFDRRVELDLMLRRSLPGNSEGGLRWNFGTGRPYTPPVSLYYIYDHQMSDRLFDPTYAQGIFFGPKNGARYPAYHRLDIILRKTWQKRWGDVTPYLNVINVYNRRNVHYYQYNYMGIPPVRTGFSMLPILPTIGVEVSF